MTIIELNRDTKEEICEYLKKIKRHAAKVEDMLEETSYDERDYMHSDKYKDYSERRYR